jgi:autotransporter translocation and assembly factor TamB
VAEALRDALDVDLLEITPVSEEGGTEVSVGNQIGERVYVKVRSSSGSSEVTQLVLEYELSKVLRLATTSRRAAIPAARSASAPSAAAPISSSS